MTIYTIGDSHCTKRFSAWGDCSNLTDIWLGAVLCYSFSKKRLKKFDIRKFNIKNNSTLIFCFGEIDCRCHIHKYITPKNSYQNIIDDIVSSYIETIKFQMEISGLTFKNISIYNVPPPVKQLEGMYENKDFPFLGSNDERRDYTLYFNKILKEKCNENNWIFFDVFDPKP